MERISFVESVDARSGRVMRSERLFDEPAGSGRDRA